MSVVDFQGTTPWPLPCRLPHSGDVSARIRGHEEATLGRRAVGVEYGDKPGRKNWAERRQAESEWQDGREPAVIILGAGQAGLTIAARLEALGVSSLIVDQNQRIGDNWRMRYHQLVLHDPVWFHHGGSPPLRA
ncbi:hypothetical protein SODALDRAFT_351447 [Sodiomyces alkalinus F11]|uniref:Uncharacterized protein n=1 Tax=Sodiomyces alkalinus (strain CBS 110278 / VKM F-3762 / F11) TaxID=1314773 RepID=A0A3N2PRD4_SODAK|nr:hypothetical protein SODALDRAFT_351447 [Sodiomyces alkalinus F11]ROT37079.1 hypothetical protein SODALDRAFT_351447 [Sodiomyces alkalinus F11]